MTKQAYAGKPEAHRAILPPAFKGFIAELRVLDAVMVNAITAENIDRCIRIMRAGVMLEGDPINQRRLFSEMLLALPVTFRPYVVAGIKQRARK